MGLIFFLKPRFDSEEEAILVPTPDGAGSGVGTVIQIGPKKQRFLPKRRVFYPKKLADSIEKIFVPEEKIKVVLLEKPLVSIRKAEPLEIPVEKKTLTFFPLPAIARKPLAAEPTKEAVKLITQIVLDTIKPERLPVDLVFYEVPRISDGLVFRSDPAIVVESARPLLRQFEEEELIILMAMTA